MNVSIQEVHLYIQCHEYPEHLDENGFTVCSVVVEKYRVKFVFGQSGPVHKLQLGADTAMSALSVDDDT